MKKTYIHVFCLLIVALFNCSVYGQFTVPLIGPEIVSPGVAVTYKPTDPTGCDDFQSFNITRPDGSRIVPIPVGFYGTEPISLTYTFTAPGNYIVDYEGAVFDPTTYFQTCGVSSKKTVTVVGVSGPTTICPNQVVTYTAPVNSAISYTWSVSGSLTLVSTSNNTVTVKASPSGSGTVSVIGTFGGMQYPGSLNVGILSSNFSTPIITGSNAFCLPTGASTSSTYSCVGVNDNNTFTWSFSGTQNTSLAHFANGGITATGKPVTVTFTNYSGDMTVGLLLQESDACGAKGPLTPFQITVNRSVPTIIPTVTGPTSIGCNGVTTANYQPASPVSGAKWQVTPSSAATLTPVGPYGTVSAAWASSFSGSASLQISATNACGAGSWSAPYNVNVSKGIHMFGSNTACTSTKSNFTLSYMTNWSNVSWSVSPAGAATFQQNGPYGAALVSFTAPSVTLYVRDLTTGCISPGFPVSVSNCRLGVEDRDLSLDETNADLELYPNPSNTGFKFKGLNYLGENVTVEITSSNGTTVAKEKGVLNSNTVYGEGLPAGVYMVTIVSDNNWKVLKYISY